MALKVPASVAANDSAGDSYISESGIQEKYAWQMDRAVQGNLTATIVRKTETGGDSSAHIEPTYADVAGLEDLSVAVYDEPKSLERRYGALFKSGSFEFVFYNVEVVATDLIEHKNEIFRAVDGTIRYNSETGRCVVLASLVDT